MKGTVLETPGKTHMNQYIKGSKQNEKNNLCHWVYERRIRINVMTKHNSREWQG